MIAPLLDAPPGVLAIPVGVAFGATLERAGLGSAQTIADQLSGRDFTVLKVMFSAIVTAMLGIFWADRLGWLDLARVSIPTTDIAPQAIGAVLFGAGFAVASLCPGTACVAAGSGHRDGLGVIGGLFAGTLITSLLWPVLGPVAEHAPRYDATLPADLHLSSGIVVAGITVMALLAIGFSDRIAARFGGSAPSMRRVSPLAAAALAVGTLAAASGRAPLASSAALPGPTTELNRESDRIDALQLAGWIHDRKAGLRVIDVRDSVATDEYRIPGAERVALQQLPQLVVRPGETIVLYDDDGVRAAQARTMLRLGQGGTGFVLRDGLAGWNDEILSPSIPDVADTAAVRRFARTRELSAWFGGRPSTAPHSGSVAGGPPARRKLC